MRSVNLLKLAIDAEILRYKSMAARQGRRAGFGVVALIFGVGFLITLEIAGWQIARMYMPAIYATLCVMGFNFLIAAAFALIAIRSSPSRSEIDALEVRKKAMNALQTSLTFSALVPAAGYLWRRRGNKLNERNLLTLRRR